jgi:hypothetical protein
MSENEDDIKQLVNLIIRPDRQRHGVKEDLGFQDEDKGIDLVSTYFEVENPRGYKLECVLLHPKEFDIEKNNSSAIIFSHGNGSNLTESSMISYFLSSEYSKFCVVGFDFSGCGNNDDKYITLGFKEQYEQNFVFMISF